MARRFEPTTLEKDNDGRKKNNSGQEGSIEKDITINYKAHKRRPQKGLHQKIN